MKIVALLLALLLLASVIVGCSVIGGPKAPEEKIDAQSLLDPENPKYYGIAAGLSAGLYSEPERLHIVSFLSAPIFTDVCVEADATQAPKQVALLQGSGILRKIKTADLNALLTEHFGITAEQSENKSGMFYDAKEDVYYFREVPVRAETVTAEGLLVDEDGVTQKAVYKTVLDNKECYVAVTLKKTESGYIITSCVKAPNNILDEPTAPTEPKETEPEEDELAWMVDPVEVEYLPYEEFFAEERELHGIGSFWEKDGKEYALYWDADGMYVHLQTVSGRGRTMHRVPNTEWIRDSVKTEFFLSDGYYGYCIRGSNEIVRVELLNGEVEVLYSGGDIMSTPAVYQDGVMYFFAREEEAVVLYRLYIPEQKLDVLYDQIPVYIPKFPWFSAFDPPDTNRDKYKWRMLNPEMVLKVNEVLANPNNPYVSSTGWNEDYGDWDKHYNHYMEMEHFFIYNIFHDLCIKHKIPYRIDCSYDYINDVYTIHREEYADQLW